ncbi:hypothetical protein FJT64_020078 [Amphibalanus amphitrite]|uniref:Uncharacterized protein n=1 Tax=Amphibalanus amphitrite TaxID=1232801 RepID=A0A6A4X2Y1_AMPAM|nr:hypothetical protein FJT64_020078 [Amphibalanus amphitrite]
MPKKTVRCSLACDADQLKAKRAQYQSILSDLAQLDTDNDASRVLNYNKREVLQLLEQIRGAAPAGRGADTPVPGWLNVETMVGAVATGRPGGRAVGRARDEAITGLGHLFYMAGAQMTSVLDESLEALLSVLRDAESGEPRRVLAIKALGEVCWSCAPAQARLLAKGGVQALVECVHNYRQQAWAARWACHTLAVALADNADVWRHLRQLETLEATLSHLALDEPLWTNWDNNHASILHRLLYGPRTVRQ